MNTDDVTKEGDLRALLVIVGLIGLAIFLISDSWRDPGPEEFVKGEEGAWAPRMSCRIKSRFTMSSGNLESSIPEH